MKLTNEIISLEFDDRNGSLIQITDLKTGQNHLGNPDDGRLFRLFVPDEDRWSDRFCDSHESGRPEFVSSPGALDIRFRNLRAGDGLEVAIAATVHVSLPPGADEALFTLTIENSDPNVVCEAIFPWVGGFTGYQGANRGKIQCGANHPFDPFKMRSGTGWNLMRRHRRTSFGWINFHAPLCDISGDGIGLSFNFYPMVPDRRHELVVMDLAEAKCGSPRPSWAWVQRPFLKPGANWTSEPVGIGPHTGDWHVTADRLRRWLLTWWKAPYAPERLRHSIGFHNAYFKDFNGRDWRSLSALPALARYGLEHGMDHFCLWDMPLLGLYTKAGKGGLFDNPPERQRELRRVLAEAQGLGVETNALINLRLVDVRNDAWKEWGEDRAVRSRYGVAIPESYPIRANNGFELSSYLEGGGRRLCQAYPAFQEWAIRQMETALEMGFGTVFIDQPFAEDYCFAEHHGHPVGAPTHAGACSWTAQVCQSIRRNNPDAWLMGEVPDIWNTQVCNLWWHWPWNWMRPEVFRYVLPESIQSWTIDAFEHEHEVGRAFAMGFLLNINVRAFELALPDVPDFAARIKRLAALRKKTASITVDARFMDNTGFTLETQASVHACRYESYQSAETCSIVLGEGSTEPGKGGGHVRLILDEAVLGDASRKHVVLHRQDGSTQQIPLTWSGSGAAVELELDRHECAVIQCNSKLNKTHL
jgi:hypothetical protein